MKQKTILLVDDNADVRFSIKEGLRNLACNYNFVEAANGEECIKHLKSGAMADLILLDIMMPLMDGWQVAAELQRNQLWKSIPIIFLTAKTDEISKGLGVIMSSDFIEKPFDIIDLKKRIETVMTH